MSKKKIKILHLTTDSKMGGTEKNIIALTAHLDKSRYESIVIALKPGGRLIEGLKEQGINGQVLGMKSILDIGKIFRLWKLMRAEKIDILQTWLWHADIIGRIIGRLAGVRVIVSSQRCLDLKSPAYKIWLNKLTSLWCDKIICVSNQVKEKLVAREKIEETKLTVIQTGLEFDADNNRDAEEKEQTEDRDKKIASGDNFYYELKKELDIKPGINVVGSVGRLRKEKGHFYFIKAAAELIQKKIPLIFLIVGDGPQEKALKALAVEYGIEDKVIFLGFRDDIPRILSLLDVFVLPSLEEGLPRAVIEAMAAGVPVIATDIGGTKELIENEKTGYLVQPGDSHGLAVAIESVISRKEEAGKVADQARSLVKEKFTLKNMVEQFEALYDQLVKEKVS